ncbi:MAG: hypothetical protein ABSD56_02420 [Bryobacteraceae bacterium]
MATILVKRSAADVAEIQDKGDHRDSRKAHWFAVKKGSEVIRDIQIRASRKDWLSLRDADPFRLRPLLPTIRVEAHTLR